MGNPTSRVLAVLELLQSGLGHGSAELAARVGIDRRTLRRYITKLEALGVPIETTRGRDGGYALRPSYRLPPMMFNEEETLALALGLHAAGNLGLGAITPAIASTQAKLSRVLPADLKKRIADIDRTVSLELGRPSSGPMPIVLASLSGAARAQQRVRLHYRTEEQETEREVDIYGLAFRGGAWYAVGHCYLREDLRSFRLDRVLSVELVPKSFGRPEGFDILAFLKRSIAMLPRTFAVKVRLDTDIKTARREVFVELGELVETPRGPVLNGQADNLDWVARELSRLPFSFVVVSPPELRAAIKAHAMRVLAEVARPREHL